MAETQQPRRDGEADFVRRIVTDPNNVPDVMRLYGYPGASSEENHDRLYLSPDLSTYVEVPRDAILHRMAVAAEQDPHGAVTLWVRRNAALIHKAAPGAQALAQYFAGAIAGAAAGTGAAAAGAPIPVTLPPAACPVTLPQAACPVTLPQAACPVTLPLAGCPTHLPQATCAPACTHITPCTPGCPTHPPQATCVPQCTHITPCLLTQVPQATCFVMCTQITPCTPACPTHVVSCAPACLTHVVASCAAICTQPALCRPTFNQPACPFPTEVCTHIAGCQVSPAPFCGGTVGAFCGPQQSIACGSIGCVPGGGFGGGM